MKKLLLTFLAIAVILTMIDSAAFAANIDWNSMSDQEITNAINQGRAVIASRITNGADHITIVNQDGITVYLTGNYEYDAYGEHIDLQLEAVVINETNCPINVVDNGCCVNGWAVDASGIYETPAGRKQKGTITLPLNEADIQTYEEITDIEFVLLAYEVDNYSNQIQLQPFTYAR